MSDIYDKLPAGAEPVAIADIYKKLPPGAEPVRLVTPNELLSRLNDALEGLSDDERYQIHTALMLAADTGQFPEDILGELDAYSEEYTGEKKAPKPFWGQVWDNFRGSAVMQWAMIPILGHLFGVNRSPENEQYISDLMSQMPEPDVQWFSLPKQVQQHYLQKAVMGDWGFEGMTPEERKEHAQQLIALNPTAAKAAAMRLYRKEKGLTDFTLLQEMVLSAAGILPQLGASTVVSLTGAAIGKAVGGPKGAEIGGKAAGLLYMAGIETAYEYLDLINQEYIDEEGNKVRLDPNIAAPVAIGVGLVNAPIEYLQWSTALKPFMKFMTHPAYKTSAAIATQRVLDSGAVARIVLKQMGKGAGKYALNVAQEAGEEGAQQLVGFLGRELAKELSNRMQGTEFEHNWEDMLGEVLGAITGAAKGFAILQAPASMFSTYQSIHAQTRAGKAEPGQIQGRVEAEPIETLEQIDQKYTKAIKTADGRIHTDPNAQSHEEIAELQRIEPDTIVQAGRVIQGRYLDEGDYYAWLQKGQKAEDLPPMAREYFVQRITETAPQVTQEQAEAIATLVETRAESEGLSLEEYTQKYFTPEMVTSMPATQEALFGTDIAVSFLKEGKALIHAAEQTDFPAFIHDMGHVWRRQLSGKDMQTIEEWAGVKEGEWTREAEEKFADGLEQYLREEKAPNSKLAELFEKFKEWLKNIYDRFAKMRMPNEVRRVYEGLLLSPEERDRRLANKPFTEEETPRETLQMLIQDIKAKGMLYTSGLNRAQINSVHRTARYGLNEQAYQYWMKLMNANPAKYRKIFAMLEGDYDSAAFWEEQGYTVVQPGETQSTDQAEAAVQAMAEEQPGGPTLTAIEEEMEEEAERIGADTSAPAVNAKKQRAGEKFMVELRDAYNKLRERWFQARDEGLLRNDVQKRQFQRMLKEALGLKRYNAQAQELDAALHFYIDSKRNPRHVERYFEIVNAETQEQAHERILSWIQEGKEEELLPSVEVKKLGRILSNLKEIQSIVERSQNLTAEEIAIAEQIEQQYQKMGQAALDAEVIHNTLEHYAGRIWDRRGKEAAPVLRRFGTTTYHSKHRVLETVLEGYVKGHRLKIKGATNSLHITTQELLKTMADKAFLKAMLGFKDVDGNPLLTTNAWLEGYDEIQHPNFVTWNWVAKFEEGKIYGKNVFITEEGDVFEKQALFAPKEQAKNLNNMLKAVKLEDWQKFLLHYNAVFKHMILVTSFFHHLAFMRSYYLGTNHKTWQEMNILKAYKEGQRAIEALSPELMLGVRNGLTLGISQEWSESLLNEDPVLDPILEKIKPAKQVVERIRALRAWWTDKLFGVFGAGLKAKAFLIEYRNELKRRPGEDPNVIARDVANMVNDDFGGLHLQRMGRSQTMQTVLRFMLLAPDWTESNVRTMIKMVGLSTDKGYGKVTKAQRKMYQRFWAMALIKGMGATVLLNYIMAGGDPERFIENYKRMWRETIRKGGIGGLRILDVDITSLYRLMGGKSDKRKYFTLIGHFRDPLKFSLVWGKSIRHKSSVLVNMFIEFMTREDWAGRRFTTIGELIRTGKAVNWRPRPAFTDFDWFPSYVISQIVGVMPVQIQNLIAALSGEQEWFESIGNSLGLGIRTTY